MPLLSVIIPVLNEKATVKEIIPRIQQLDLDKEIVIIDDFSTDGTREILKELNGGNIRVFYNESNMGKGAAVRKAIGLARGEIMIIQDADLEYNPQDYHILIEPLLNNQADLVMGDRFSKPCRCLFIHKLGNKFLSWFLSFLFGYRIRDYATCYKIAYLKTFRSLNLKALSFELEVEIVCQALKAGLRIKEIPISYCGRSYQEGKKIRIKDGLWAIFYMLKYRLEK